MVGCGSKQYIDTLVMLVFPELVKHAVLPPKFPLIKFQAWVMALPSFLFCPEYPEFCATHAAP